MQGRRRNLMPSLVNFSMGTLSYPLKSKGKIRVASRLAFPNPFRETNITVALAKAMQ